MEQKRLDIEAVKALIAEHDWQALDRFLDEHPYPEIAEEFRQLSLAERLAALRHVEPELAVEIFDDLETPFQVEILERLRPRRAARFVEEMSPDERADLVAAMPEALLPKVMALLPDEEREDIEELTRYGEETAGGRMTSEFVRIATDATVGEALEVFRRRFTDVEMIYYFYVLDAEERLVGVVSLRDLLSNPAATHVGEIMRSRVYAVSPDADQEVAAEQLALYDFYALPVADPDGRMLGVLTFDDVMDVLEEEAVEDHEFFGGLTPSHEDDPPRTLGDRIWQRLPWLLGFLALGSLSGFLLSGFLSAFDGAGASGLMLFGVLVSLQPMLTGTAGNAGTQSVTLSIQALASGHRDWSAWRGIVMREAGLGLTIGGCLAAVAFGRAMLAPDHRMFLGATVALAVVFCVTLSTCLGAFLPLLFKRLGLDPAVISSPLITTLMDLISVLVYYLLALWMLPWYS